MAGFDFGWFDFGCFVQGKARVLSADEDAKAAALQWASEAAFGNTEVAAPKILGDIVESLVGAVYIDTGHDFDKTWQVGLLSASVIPMALLASQA